MPRKFVSCSRRHNCRVFTVGGGTQPLHTLHAEHAPDLLIVDLMLPGDDGFMVSYDARKHSDILSLCSPPVLIPPSRNESIRAELDGQRTTSDMVAGHGGASGRFKAWRDSARQDAFILWALGLVQ